MLRSIPIALLILLLYALYRKASSRNGPRRWAATAREIPVTYERLMWIALWRKQLWFALAGLALLPPLALSTAYGAMTLRSGLISACLITGAVAFYIVSVNLNFRIYAGFHMRALQEPQTARVLCTKELRLYDPQHLMCIDESCFICAGNEQLIALCAEAVDFSYPAEAHNVFGLSYGGKFNRRYDHSWQSCFALRSRCGERILVQSDTFVIDLFRKWFTKQGGRVII